MTAPLSTSERLRQTQQALAASQADLTRVTDERNQFRSNYLRDAARVDRLDGDLVDMELDLADARAERDEAVRRAADLEQVREELGHRRALADGYAEDVQRLEGEHADLVDQKLALKAELASATAELKILRIQLAGVVRFASAYEPGERSWQVARNDDGLRCTRCAQTIRRGEAVAPTPAAKGHFEHVECRDPESEES